MMFIANAPNIHHHKLLRYGRWLAIGVSGRNANCQTLPILGYYLLPLRWEPMLARSQEGLRGVPKMTHTSFPTILPGWWFEPLWNILVKWEGSSHTSLKIKNVWNDQPVTDGQNPLLFRFLEVVTGDIATCIETTWIRRTKRARHGLLNGVNEYSVQENA